MKKVRPYLLAFPLALLTFLSTYSQAAEMTSVAITEWKVPWQSTRPRDPALDSKGNVWFCGQSGNYIAVFDVQTNKFKRFELDENTNPHNLIVDDKDYVWYAGNKNAHIGKLNPLNGEVTRFNMPESTAYDPHTLVFGAENDIWFTAQHSNYIGRLNRNNGEIKLLKVPSRRSRPYGIKMDPNNRPWAALLGTNRLATIKDEKIKEIILPRSDARPRRLEITSNGNIWYVDYSGGYLGRYNPNKESFKEWQMPGGDTSKPYGTALDSKDRIWVVETGSWPNKFVGFNTKTSTFFSHTEVPSGGLVRHMYYDGIKNEVWFGVDTDFIGKASVK